MTSQMDDFIAAALQFAETRRVDQEAVPELVRFWANRVDRTYEEYAQSGTDGFMIAFTLTDCPRHLEVLRQLVRRYEAMEWSHRLSFSDDGWTLYLANDKRFSVVDGARV